MTVERPLIRDMLNGTLNSRIETTQFFAGFNNYGMSQFEADAGVTPVDYSFPPGDVRRYGAVGDGVTDDAPAFNAAAQATRFNQGGTIFIGRPAVQYLLLSPWNLTDGSAGGQSINIVVRGEGSIAYGSNASAAILIKHTGHAVDMTGAMAVHWYDVTFATDASTYPDVGFFHSRCSASNASQYHRYTNVNFSGKCSIAIRYNFGSEDIQDVGCQFYNYATDANRRVCITTQNNIRSLTSTFVTVSSPTSTIDHKIFGGEYALLSSTNGSSADVFELEQVNAFRSHDIWVKATGCRSIFNFNPTNAPSNNFVVDGMWIEDAVTLPQYALYFPAASATQTPQNISVQNSRLATSVRAIFAGANIRLSVLTYRGITESSSLGIEAETIINSDIVTSSLLTIQTSTANHIVGDPDNWTIGTRTDAWTDTSANGTWTPVLGAGVTAVGATTIDQATFQYTGKYLELAFRASAVTSLTATANAQITGLPRANKDSTGPVIVTNADIPAPLGTGYVTGNSLRLPAFAVGANVSVIFYARYRVA